MAEVETIYAYLINGTRVTPQQYVAHLRAVARAAWLESIQVDRLANEVEARHA